MGRKVEPSSSENGRKEERRDLKTDKFKGTWVVHSVECLTIDFGSGHDLVVHEIRPHAGLCAELRTYLGSSLSFSLSLPCLHSLKINK